MHINKHDKKVMMQALALAAREWTDNGAKLASTATIDCDGTMTMARKFESDADKAHALLAKLQTQANHVDPALALATMEIAPLLMPNGWIAETNSPGTLADCAAAYLRHGGRPVVSDWWKPGETLMGSPDHWQAFNAWHDFCHITLGATFDPAGERRVNDMMHHHLLDWWRKSKVPITSEAYKRAAEVLTIHNVGRLDYWTALDHPPENPRDFALGYLTARGMLAIKPHCHGMKEQFPREARQHHGAP